MATIGEYNQLKRDVEIAQREYDQAQGALSELLKQLKDEFRCSSVEEAETELKQLKKEEKEEKDAFDKAFEAFEEKWKDRI